MKLSCCTKGSMRVLNTWAASGAVGIGLERDLVAVLAGLAGDGGRRQRGRGEHVEQLVDADALLGRDADDRRERARGDRLDQQLATVRPATAARLRSTAPSPLRRLR